MLISNYWLCKKSVKSSNKGEVKINESQRSRKPPSPNKIEPESFNWASLLNIDSAMSPHCPNTPMIIVIIMMCKNDKL